MKKSVKDLRAKNVQTNGRNERNKSKVGEVVRGGGVEIKKMRKE